MTSDPLTHTVYYAGHRFQVAQKQAATIVNALMYAHTRGATGFFGIPASDAGNGNTVMRYLLIGPGIPVLVDGPKLEGIGTKQGTSGKAATAVYTLCSASYPSGTRITAAVMRSWRCSAVGTPAVQRHPSQCGTTKARRAAQSAAG